MLVYTGFDPYSTGKKVFSVEKQSFEEGITVLVGCNGCGKTSLMNCIEKASFDEKIPVFRYNEQNSKTNSLNLGEVTTNISAFIKNAVKQNKKKVCLLLDTIDNGSSADTIANFMDFLHYILKRNEENEVEIYIVLQANNYATCKNERCRNCYTGENVFFHDYEEYENFIFATRRIVIYNERQMCERNKENKG